jgi:hypothetical protein
MIDARQYDNTHVIRLKIEYISIVINRNVLVE